MPRRTGFPRHIDRVTRRPGDWISPGAEKHTERTFGAWVLEQFQWVMGFPLGGTLWDMVLLFPKPTEIRHLGVLQAHTLAAGKPISLLHHSDCAISRAGF